ncbi:MAG: 4Fe-4S binding protein, partial [Firmicutes bacterium]|nr:4Fe-4S binding protein [Bacillota bacterium]
MKAIKLRSGQANVVPELCISCGLCVEACPQKAKTVISQAEEVMALLAAGEEVCVSLAPSYAVAFDAYSPGQVVAALKQLGFARVEETALAAEAVAAHYCQRLTGQQSTMISSCCPTIVNLVEIHFPQLLPLMAPSASPMVIHGLSLRARFPKAKTVFIGPCIAKIQEASRPAARGSIDAVLTFQQLESLWAEQQIDPSQLQPMQPDAETQTATVYPLSRGILSTAGLDADTRPDCLAVSGLDACIEVFNELSAGEIRPRFIEALACPGGCINGSGISKCSSPAYKRSRLLQFHLDRQRESNKLSSITVVTSDSLPQVSYQARNPNLPIPTESEIRNILVQIGKHTAADESNCGGCGYPSCRDKAIR